MFVKGAIGDETLVGRVVASLVAEGLEASAADGAPAADALILFLVTRASAADPAFMALIYERADRALLAIADPGALVAGPTFDLTDWNGTDRRHAGFRDLARAIRAEGDAEALDLTELARQRHSAVRRAATTSAVNVSPSRPAQPQASFKVAPAPSVAPPMPSVAPPMSYSPVRVRLGARFALWAGAGVAALVVLPIALVSANFSSHQPDGGPQSQAALGGGTGWLLVAGVGAVTLATAGWAIARRLRREAPRPSAAAPAVRPPAPAASQPAPRDEVDVSAFVPAAVRPGGTAVVQIFLHLAADAEAAAGAAAAADSAAMLRTAGALAVPVARGERIDVLIEMPGGAVDEPSQYLTWRGVPRSCQFLVTAPPDAAAPLAVVARLFVGGVPVGRLTFTLELATGEAARRSVALVADAAARRFRRAFLSYASPDRVEVLKRVDALRAAGIGFFQDILSIDPGAEWEPRLFAEIDRCDLFLLFWSSAASQSAWVVREAEYALQRRGASAEHTPEITPIILEGPPPPAPPPSLRALHFNDVLRYIVVASELERQARAAASARAPTPFPSA